METIDIPITELRFRLFIEILKAAGSVDAAILQYETALRAILAQ